MDDRSQKTGRQVLVVRAVIVVLAVHLGALPAPAEWTEFLGQLLKGKPQTPHPAVVRVIAPEKGATSMGSGCLIWVEGDYGWVLSNWHVVRGATGPIEVVFPDGFRSPAEVTKTDETWDLALLGIWRPRAAPVALASEVPQVGDALSIAGYGQGSYRQARGVCRHYAAPGLQQPQEMIELSATARQGDSGGPILNSRGELAGVLFGSGSGLTTGSHIGRVRTFLAGANESQLAVNSPSTRPGREMPAFVPTGTMPALPAPPAHETLSGGASPAAMAGQAPPPFFPTEPLSKPVGHSVASAQPLRIDELEQLRVAPTAPLPFEELAANGGEKWTRRITRTADVQPQAQGPIAQGDEPNWSQLRHVPESPDTGWRSRGDDSRAEAVASHDGALTGAPPAPLLEIPPPSHRVARLPAVEAPPVQLPLPLTDTKAFLTFVATVAALIYTLPRGTSKVRPGAKTAG